MLLTIGKEPQDAEFSLQGLVCGILQGMSDLCHQQAGEFSAGPMQQHTNVGSRVAAFGPGIQRIGDLLSRGIRVFDTME